MNETKEQKKDRTTIDKKRLVIALLILLTIAGVGAVWAKDAIPEFLGQKRSEVQTKAPENASGQVAGEEIDRQKEALQKQIDEIKESITKLKPQDLQEQEPVQKILKDLDSLAKTATESAKILDVKGNLCEEAKRRFCE